MLRSCASRLIPQGSRAFSSAGGELLARRRPRHENAVSEVDFEEQSNEQAMSDTSVTPAPVRLFGGEARYAHAAYAAALRDDAMPLEKVQKELDMVNGMISANATMQKFFNDPTVKRGEKQEIIQDVVKGAEGMTKITSNLLVALAENGRLPMLPKIAEMYGSIMKAHNNEVSATVTSAAALDGAIATRVQGALKKFVGESHTVSVDFKVDPSIMGGLVVDVGDKHVDLSVSNRISQLQRVLEQPI